MTHSYQNPKAYSENNALQYQFAMRLVEGIKVSHSSRVLDLGCGDGLITSKLAERVQNGKVIGTDISETMVTFAANKYSHIANLSFMQMDAARNTFENTFDLITSFNALHWVKDQAAVLSGIAKAARLNATIFLLFSHKKSRYHHTLDELSQASLWQPYFIDYINPRSFYEKDVYTLLVKNAGLDNIDICEEEMVYYFESSTQLKNFFRASMANIKQIPDHLKEAYLSELTDRYLTQLNLSDNTKIPLSFWCLVVKAAKLHR